MKLAEMYAAQKEQVSSLYASYAEAFTAYAAFWKNLAEEEARGAKNVRKSLPAAAIIPPCGLPSGSFSHLLQTELKLTHEPRLSLLHAFTAAFEIEQMLSVSISVKDLEATPAKLKNILIGSLAADRSHLEQIRLAMGKFS